MITEVERKMKNLSKERRDKLIQVKKLMENAACVSKNETIRMVTQGNFRDVPFDNQDIFDAMDLLGKSAEFLKGRTVKRKFRL